MTVCVLFQPSHCKQVVFSVQCHIFVFLCFLLVISQFPVGPMCSAEVRSKVPESRKAMVSLREKTRFIRPRVMVLLATSSVSASQEYMLNDEVSLNRNTHYTKLCIDPSVKIL